MPINSFRGDYRFLSNFYPAETEYEGLSYPTSEHAYQAAKSLNISVRIEIGKLPSPTAAKRNGQGIFLRPDWDSIKVQVMKDIIASKFSDLELRAMLYNTWGQQLVEGNNWHDQFWGDCTCLAHADVPGLNMLGVILMNERMR